MKRKLFLSENIKESELNIYLTPNKLGWKDPKSHFIKSIEIKTNYNNVDWFTELKQLPLESLDYIINLLSYSYFRRLAFNFFTFDKNIFDSKEIQENLLDIFKKDKNKWDLSKNQCNIISISELNWGFLISFSFSDGEKTFLDINQDYKTINKLMINWVYISPNWYMSFIWVKKSSTYKQIYEIVSTYILKTKFNPIKFHELHFGKFYWSLEQITKSGQFEEISWERVKSSFTRAESKTNLKKFIKIWDFADLRWYLIDEKFKNINILMSKSKTFPQYTFSILKDISDEKLVELFDFINSFLFNDSKINILSDLWNSFFKLLEKKLRWDWELFLVEWNSIIPNDLVNIIKENSWVKFCYHYWENTTDWKSDDNFEQSNIFLYEDQKELELCNWKIIKIDENVEFWLTLDINSKFLENFEFDETIGFFKKLEHSSDETKDVLFIISEKKYEDIIHNIKIKNKSLIEDNILSIISFNKEDLKEVKNWYKIKSRKKYSKTENNKDLIFEASFELLNIINWDLKDYFIDWIYWKLENDLETEFFKVFYSNDNVKLNEIQNIFYSDKKSLEVCKELIENFKNHIEDKSSFLVRQYISTKNIEKERKEIEIYIQELFDITTLHSYSHILPEVNTHRWPIDFLSISKDDYTIIEFKLASNSKIKDNLKFQTETYKKTLNNSSKEIHEIKVVFYDNKDDFEKVNKIINDEWLDKNKFYFINYSKNISWSKVTKNNQN